MNAIVSNEAFIEPIEIVSEHVTLRDSEPQRWGRGIMKLIAS